MFAYNVLANHINNIFVYWLW